MADGKLPPILSHYQVTPLLEARQAGAQRTELSLDLGLTTVQVQIDTDGVSLPDGQQVGWPTIGEIASSENSCFLLQGGELTKIQVFSELTNRLYSLMPTSSAPTMLVSGIPMHRIKDSDPHRDTLAKVKTLQPLRGRVLDTATGLGYTAIEAARTADCVTTIELAPAALELARLNPWSQELFGNSKITQLMGDSYDLIEGFEGGSFDRIIHDPPAFNLAGDLYSGGFYAELYRVLRSRGRLFHYIGDPESRSGRSVTRGVIRRLQEAGFTRVTRQPRAFGVTASRGG
jgi:predicted methyltransferase